MNNYFQKWKIKVSTIKTQALFITKRNTQQLLTIQVVESVVPWYPTLKYLGFISHKSLKINDHIN